MYGILLFFKLLTNKHMHQVLGDENVVDSQASLLHDTTLNPKP